MLCQNCKTNAATIFYKETAGGRTTEYSLCPACAAKLQIGMPFGGITEDDPLTSLFAGMLGHSRAVREEKRCPVCGAGFRELAAKGKMGCPACYEAFADELAPTVKQLHGSVKSRGHAPRRFGEKQRLAEELQKLRGELKAAIDTQEFEKAAELRDRICALEGGNN